MFKSLNGESSLTAKFHFFAKTAFTFGTYGMLLDDAI